MKRAIATRRPGENEFALQKIRDAILDDDAVSGSCALTVKALEYGWTYEETAFMLQDTVRHVRTNLKRFLMLYRAARAFAHDEFPELTRLANDPSADWQFDFKEAMKNPDLDSIADYLAKDLWPDERLLVERRLAEDDDFARFAAPIVEFWKLGCKLSPADLDEMEEYWAELRKEAFKDRRLIAKARQNNRSQNLSPSTAK